MNIFSVPITDLNFTAGANEVGWHVAVIANKLIGPRIDEFTHPCVYLEAMSIVKFEKVGRKWKHYLFS